MNATLDSGRRRSWSRNERLSAGVTAAALAAVLCVAAVLEPDARGLGTHRQLGLPPCTLVYWFGLRCPSCGMTTSWSHMVRGQVGRAVAANVGGALLCLTAMVLVPWLAASAVVGRWIVRRPSDAWVVRAALAVVAITLVDWSVRLAAGS